MASSETGPPEAPRPVHPIRRFAIGVVVIILVLVALAPTIIAKTALRDRLINAAVADESLHASTRSASIGYFSPVVVQGFDLRADDGSLQVAMQSFESEKSWLTMLFAGGDLGGFRFRKPVLHVVTGIASTKADPGLDEESSTENMPIKSLPTLVAEVIGGGVQVRNVSRKDPAVDLHGIDFTIRTEQHDFGTLVHVEPTTILDEQPLTPELCSQGLQLIAPMLSDAILAEGRLSLKIDQCSVPVGDLNQQQRQQLTDIGGAIRLSDVSVGLSNEITAGLLALLERFGRVRDDVRLTVSRASEVQFRVVGGRVHHRGLMFFLPIGESEFELTSSGSVGFDETLDLKLALGLPESLLGDGPLAKFLTSDPIVIQVSGSVDEPKIDLASTIDWNDRLSSVLEALGRGKTSDADGQTEEQNQRRDPILESAGAVLGIVDGLLDRNEPRETSPLRNLIERRRLRGDSEEDPPRRRPGLLPRRRGSE